MPRTIGLFGQGRLGSLIADALTASPDLHCAWRLSRDEEPTSEVDVAIDVSHPDAVPGHLAWATDTATDLVIGTTGWSPEALRRESPDRAVRAGASNGVLIAPNFSLSMALMRRFAAVLGGYAQQSEEQVDLAVTETHHRGKVDAPSGSAILLAQALAQAAGRPPEDVATTSLRMGAIVGRHDVRFETPSEAIVLSHEAHSRTLFATGAVSAARWIHGRTGVYTIDDWATDQLDELFTPSSMSPRSTPPQEHT